MREGLRLLRQAQVEILDARDEFIEAAQEGDASVGEEAQRLVELVNELWEHRVIP